MSLKNDIAYMSACQLAESIRELQFSALEATQAILERIDDHNEKLNAVVHCPYDEALLRAHEADQQLRDGKKVGPLHGVPTLIKDLADSKAGWPSTCGGIPALSKNLANETTPYTAKLEEAGALVIGLSNSPVMGFRGTTDNYLYGPTRNPYNTKKNSGGSSGGSASAVAGGLVPFAQGTDGGGSIRIPSSWCGVFGFQASFGRIPQVVRPNAFGAVSPFLYSGPITRTVDDAALVLAAVVGYDARDPYSLPDTNSDVLLASKPIKDLRIGYSPDLGVFPVDPLVRQCVDECVADIRASGIEVRDLTLKFDYSQEQLSDAWIKLILPFAISGMHSFRRAGLDLLVDYPSDLPPELLQLIETGEQMKVTETFSLHEIRSHVFDVIQKTFEDIDLLISPTMACLAVDNAEDGNTLGPSIINGASVDNLIGYCMTYMTNFTGHPAASVPAGLAANGLPVGIQVMGRRYADGDILAFSRHIEQVRPWIDSYRSCVTHPDHAQL